MRYAHTALLALTLALTATALGQAPEVKLKDPLQETFYNAKSALADRTDVAVTVYNNGLALVRDTRKLILPPGEVSLEFGDVAQQIRPETVSLKSLTDPAALAIIEQNYAYDLMSPSKLMEKYVGKDVRLVNFSSEVGFQEKDAKLLSVNEGAIYQADGEIYLGHPGTVVLPEIPANLIARPALIWLLANQGTDHQVEVTYLTGGIGWKADYVITLARDEKSMGLEGWVTLNNQSGATYDNAQLKLVAGEVNIVPQAAPEEAVMALGYADMDGAMPAPMREEAFAEYHLYTLPRRTTIKENESKQVSLLSGESIAVEKVYEYRGQADFYSRPIPELKDQKVGVFLKFRNEEGNGLGIPLPAGTMRVYQEDSEGMLQFSGEDRLEHTPKDEDVRLKLGNAFDITAERKQTDYRQISDRVFENSFEIKIRNHKEMDIVVDVIEPMTDDWEILEKSHDFEKRDARTAVFKLPVPKDGEVILTYRVRVRY